VVISCHSDYKSEASTKTWQRVGFKQPQKSIKNWSIVSKGLMQIEPKHWSNYKALHVLAQVILEGFLSWKWLNKLFPECTDRMHLHFWDYVPTSSMQTILLDWILYIVHESRIFHCGIVHCTICAYVINIRSKNLHCIPYLRT